MIISLNINPSTHATALAQVIALATANDIEFGIVDTTSTTQSHVNAPTPQPKAEKPKVLAPATDTMFPIVSLDGTFNTFNLGYGAGKAGAKLLIKAHGWVWDKDLGAYANGSLENIEIVLDESDHTKAHIKVPAEWIQKGRDKAAEKAARRG